jgi:RNA 3'-terminal phosphate cyclase (ATP)
MTERGWVRIDGSEGEGGGQLLRTSLTLSMLTARPFEIIHIRAGRPNPGLQAQHLQALLAAQEICAATVEGAAKGSLQARFIPGEARGGHYRFDIGTAGATSLVLHTLYLPLSRCHQPSPVQIRGGTHVLWSPTYEHLTDAWLPCLRAMGLKLQLTLLRAGFYPHGGGELVARIDPVAAIQPLRLTSRGTLQEVRVFSAHTNLKDEVARRQARAAEHLLRQAGLQPVVEASHLPSLSRNTICAVTGSFQHTQVCYSAVGERGKRAEQVAEEACRAFLAFLRTDATVDEYLADQLLLPMALASGPSFMRTPQVTQHLLSNIATIQKFLPAVIHLSGALGDPGDIEVTPCSSLTSPWTAL